ncbi:unnamed protein product [Polarella glacialis]|uniref:J domain-containing protein n=1 Tax=Polarella glacialis TaxID=89957 RepID=A0A813HL89_POLGL|nr:unnamed protein product [Polarella glacialis]
MASDASAVGESSCTDLEVHATKRQRVTFKASDPSRRNFVAGHGVRGTESGGSGSGTASSSRDSGGVPGNLLNPRGHYDILGIQLTATRTDVTKAFRRQALKTHPDKGGKNEDWLAVVNSFEVLSDQNQRAEYDMDLVTQGCSDGQQNEFLGESPGGTRTEAGSEGLGAETEMTDSSKAIRSRARVGHIVLLASSIQSWTEQLNATSTPVLETLSSHLTVLLNRNKRGRNSMVRDKRDEAEFPREIAPPEGLPLGWKCIEHMYLSGKCVGLTYCRYTSPWGHKHFQGVPSTVKFDAEQRGYDVDAALSNLNYRKPGPKDGKEQKVAAGQKIVQKCIYTTRDASDNPRYWVNCNFAYFRIYTSRTSSLAEAIDWHIALSQAKEKAQRRLWLEEGAGAPTPFTQQELCQLLEAEPSLDIKFSSNMSKGPHKNVYTPMTDDLKIAMSLHRRFHALLEQGTTKKEIDNVRVQACAEVAQNAEARRKLHARLAKAVEAEMQTRGKRPKLEDVASSVPSVSSCPPARARHASEGQSVTPEKLPLGRKSGSGSSSSAAQLQGQQGVPSAAARIALQLQAALGLDEAAALNMARVARRLTAEERRRRVDFLLSGGRLALPASVSHCQGGQRGTASGRELALPSSQSAAGSQGAGGPARASSSSQRQLALLQTPRREQRGGRPQSLQPVPTPRSPQPKRPPAPPSSLRPGVFFNGGAWSQGTGAVLTPPVCACLTIAEVCRLRASSSGGAASGDLEFWTRFKVFKYATGFLDTKPERTRSGRSRRASHLATGMSAAAARLVCFLARPRHAAMFEQLDLCQAPVEALENRALQAAVGRMAHLALMALPWDGWSDPGARRRFLRALPLRCCFQAMDCRGTVQLRGVGGDM